jgi:hypothetical protein
MKARLLLGIIAISASSMARAEIVPGAGFSAGILAAHNAQRAALSLAPLVWDNDLAKGASEYAVRMAATGLFEHSDRHARRGIGENIWSGGLGSYRVGAAVNLWASDKRYFRPGIFPDVSRTGNWYDASHYTQLIWPGTRRVGCALASSRTADYVVCRYFPAGNIDGTRLP